MERFRATSSIRFYCRDSKRGRDGLSPVEMSINLNGHRFFTNLPRKSDSRSFQKVMDGRIDKPLQDYLMAIEASLRAFETKCLLKGKRITTDDIKAFIRNGFYAPTENIGYLINRFYAYIDGKDIQPCVKQKYRLVLSNFLQSSGLTLESGLEDITVGRCKEFVEYMTGKYKNSSVCGMLHRFKAFLQYGVDNNYLDKNPFVGIKIKKQEVQIETITNDEYNRIKALDLSWCERLEKVRDLFIFSCGTGLAYTDAQNLNPSDFKTNDDGQYYIQKERCKTGIQYTVVVLPDALDVAKKYGYNLPRISNQKMNGYLKEIQDQAKVGVNITCHKARHYYARRLINDYHFSLEVVARCLGHSNINMSKHYAKLFSTTVFDAFKQIGNGV